MNTMDEYKIMLEKFMKDEISLEEWFSYCETLKNDAAKAAQSLNKK
jgi:hypothetical protein